MEDSVLRDKPFMTYEQQIAKLRDDKKLEISDEEYAISLLKEHSYFALISGYKEPFKDKNGDYKLHTSIKDIYALYSFDDSLRALLLRYILKIEKHVKSLISYSFCEKYGDDQQHYLNATKYNYNAHNHENMLVQMLDLLARVRNEMYPKFTVTEIYGIPV